MQLSFDTLTPLQVAYVVLAHRRDSDPRDISRAQLTEAFDKVEALMTYKEWEEVKDLLWFLYNLDLLAFWMTVEANEIEAISDLEWTDNDQAAFTAQFD